MKSAFEVVEYEAVHDLILSCECPVVLGKHCVSECILPDPFCWKAKSSCGSTYLELLDYERCMDLVIKLYCPEDFGLCTVYSSKCDGTKDECKLCWHSEVI